MGKIELKDISKKLVENYTLQKGDLIRQMVRVIAEYYKKKPEELKDYFDNKNFLIEGIATSAYHLITGDITPMQSRQLGGLGAIILESPMELEFKLDQLHFAQIFGTSLRGAKLLDNAGWKAEAYESSLGRAECRDNAMTYSKLYDWAGLGATLKDNSMKYSIRTKNTLYKVRIDDDALYGSKIIE